MFRFLLFLPVLMNFTATYSQSKKTIDSINTLYVQGLNIPQDSIVALFQQNLKDAEKISYELGMAGAHSQLSLVYAYQGKYEESTKSSIEGIKIYEKLNQLDRVADYYAEMGYSMKYRDMEKALYYMQKGKAIAEANNFENELKDIYNNYGVLKEINKELDSALFYFEKGLQIKLKLNDTIGIPYSWSNLAGVYGLQENFSKSREYFSKSLQQRLQWADSLGIAENYTQLGEVFVAEQKWRNAIPLVHKSLPISKKKQYQNLTQYNYKLLSDIYKKLKNTDSALYYFEQYAAIKDSVHGLKVQERIAALNVEFETEKKQNEILQQRAQLAEKDLEVRRKNTFIFGSLGLALILGLLGYLLYNQQKLRNRQLQKEGELKTALAKIETQNKLQEQRLRISRDLHDNIGAQLTFIISSIDNLKFGFTDISEKLGSKLSNISSFTQQTIYELRDTIWAMNKENITFEDLQARIANFIEHAKNASEKTDFSFNIEGNIDEAHVFSSVVGMNIYRIIQEAVNNALKYASADEIEVNISEKEAKYNIEITDDGIGFDQDNTELGNGLNNMKKRAREVGGTLQIKSSKKGTSVLLKVPK
ncbi:MULTISPECIES: tetratricopeptide repeat protein [Aequorivita]|uniref:Tetratricopeptide repeat protein n=1 Tax=Aequorivita iocasae TaxID=2803865 RepID=A0ABX7DMS8_9FLAO|nr:MULTISPECIES: tetratricopeptide repeat protein [Aequorivita]QQX75350.1 tetratricopeptide repeat protein [Aequorivita iocasae]UCA54800.1 sensor histidine kinase [Aequorivita sp. F7]